MSAVENGSAAYYERESAIHEAAAKIVRRVTENAVRVAIRRHELLQYDGTPIDDQSEQDHVQDAVRIALGEDTGCLEADDLNEANCELLFVEAELHAIVKRITEQACRRSCNRHDDCDAAEATLLARNPGKTKTDINPSFHCHDECCEDCFGS